MLVNGIRPCGFNDDFFDVGVENVFFNLNLLILVLYYVVVVIVLWGLITFIV